MGGVAKVGLIEPDRGGPIHYIAQIVTLIPP